MYSAVINFEDLKEKKMFLRKKKKSILVNYLLEYLGKESFLISRIKGKSPAHFLCLNER